MVLYVVEEHVRYTIQYYYIQRAQKESRDRERERKRHRKNHHPLLHTPSTLSHTSTFVPFTKEIHSIITCTTS
jgi:hypothetical protein